MSPVHLWKLSFLVDQTFCRGVRRGLLSPMPGQGTGISGGESCPSPQFTATGVMVTPKLFPITPPGRPAFLFSLPGLHSSSHLPCAWTCSRNPSKKRSQKVGPSALGKGVFFTTNPDGVGCGFSASLSLPHLQLGMIRSQNLICKKALSSQLTAR